MVHLVAVGRVGDALSLLSAHDAMRHGGGDSGDSGGMLLDGPRAGPPASVLPQVRVRTCVCACVRVCVCL